MTGSFLNALQLSIMVGLGQPEQGYEPENQPSFVPSLETNRSGVSKFLS
jgi:hypothetical protein